MAFKMKGMAFKDGQSPMTKMSYAKPAPIRNMKDGEYSHSFEKESPVEFLGALAKGVGTVAKGVGKAAAKVGKGIGEGVKKVAKKVKAGKVARKAKKVAKSAANDAIREAGGTVKETLGSQLKSAGVDMAKNVATDQITNELNRDKTKKVASTSDFSNINFGG